MTPWLEMCREGGPRAVPPPPGTDLRSSNTPNRLPFTCSLVQGTPFDYYVDPANGGMLPWAQRTQEVRPAPSGADLLGTGRPRFVETAATARLQWLCATLLSAGHAVMLVGPSGEWWAFAGGRARAGVCV